MVKRFDLELFHCNGGEMSVSEEGGWVDYEDFAALQKERDALAAECASMRNAIDQTIGWQKSVDPENEESVRLLVDLKTPATDAFLNAVRADVITSLWSESLRDVGRVLTEIRAFHDESEAGGIVHDEIKERIDDFVAQLRATAPERGSNNISGKRDDCIC